MRRLSPPERNAPRRGDATCHRDGTVTLFDGVFWTRTDGFCASWVRAAVARLDAKTRARVRKHLEWSTE